MTTASSTPVAAGPTSESVRTSWWAVVGSQLRRRKGTMVAWRLAQGLVALAVAAPLFAFNVPLFWRDSGGSSSPLLESLFDRFLFPGGVDVFYNVLLLAGPVWLSATRLGRFVEERRAGRTSRRFPWSLPVLIAALAIEVWVALHSRPAFRIALLAIVVPTGVLLLLRARVRRRSPKAARRMAMAVPLVFVVGFVVLLTGYRETQAVRDWRVVAQSADVTAVFPPVPFHPDNVGETGVASLGRAYKRPNSENWLGCDPNGRDVVSRLVFGTRISISIGLVAVSIYVMIGIVLGSLAGFYAGRVDLVISRLIEMMICFPTLFLILTIIAVFDSRSIFMIMGVIGLVGWPGVARLVRGEFLRERGRDYVTAALAQGLPKRKIVFGHVLPNALGPVLVAATFGIAASILTESGLAFLGLGDTNTASWGQMLTSGRDSMMWHLILAPGLAIFFVVTVFNLLGEGLRDALDPKLRR